MASVSDCGKKGHARRGCQCARCVRVREREREYGRKYREAHREEYREQQREYRKRTNNAHTKRYEKTPKGFLMRAYRNMQSRVEGIQKQGSWTGKEILPRQDFYDWALDHPEFRRLFRQYEKSGYEQRLAPSPNRIDPRRGYTLDNMEWVTHSVNSALSSLTKRRPPEDALLKEVAELVA